MFRGALFVLALTGSACVTAYSSQLFMGRWQTDEYRLFTTERTWGWHALIPRLAYSPRPFSEGVLFLYGKAVLAADRPLIISFLGLVWGTVLGVSIIAARSSLPPSRVRSVTAVGLVTSLFAFVLVNAKVTEAFYWPMAAAAYMPTGGGALVLLFLLSRSSSRAGRIGCSCALLVAAGSSEVGAVLACGFAAAALLDALVRRGRPSPRDVWWIIPGLLGLAEFVTTLSVRANIPELGAAAHAATGHFWLDLRLALLQFAIDLLGGRDAQGEIAPKFADELLFAAAFVSVWRLAGGTAPSRSHAILSFSLAVAAFFSLLAAYFHYGTACCERQAATRRWLIDMLLILLVAFAMRKVPTRRLEWLPPLLLTASLYPVFYRVDGMRADASVYRLATDSRSRTWASGLQKTGTMKFYLLPEGSQMLIRGTAQPIGTFRTSIDAPEMVAAVGGFFRKSVVIVCEPWQTEKSWLLNGQFIPACPPHPGPPDIVYDSRR